MYIITLPIIYGQGYAWNEIMLHNNLNTYQFSNLVTHTVVLHSLPTCTGSGGDIVKKSSEKCHVKKLPPAFISYFVLCAFRGMKNLQWKVGGFTYKIAFLQDTLTFSASFPCK